MILLLAFDLFDLFCYCCLVGRCLYVADNTKSYREAVLVVHHGKLQLQSVIFAVSVVYKNVLLCNTILTNLYNLQSEAFLYETKLIVLAEDQRLTMLNVDGVLLSAFALVDRIVGTVVEDNTVLQDFAYRSTFMQFGSLEDIYCSCSVCSHRTCKEVTSCTEAKLCRTERILYCSVRRRLADETARTRWRILSLGESVDTVVEQNHVKVDVTAHGMDEMVSTNGKSVTVTANLPDGEVWIGNLRTSSNSCCTTMDGLHGICINIIWKTA